MLTSRRDYLMRIIDEVTRLIASAIFKRRTNADQEALETVVLGFERLFQLDGDQIFQLTPDQHFTMLAHPDDDPEFVRERLLLYAALSAEAGAIYARRGNAAMARATRLNALRFVLKAPPVNGPEELPPYAPKVDELLDALGDAPLDADVVQLLSAARMPPRTSPPQSAG